MGRRRYAGFRHRTRPARQILTGRLWPGWIWRPSPRRSAATGRPRRPRSRRRCASRLPWSRTTAAAVARVLRGLPPYIAREEERVAVLPLVRGLIQEPWCGSYPEVGNRLASRGIAKLRIIDEVADEGDLGVACCHRILRSRRDDVGSGLEAGLAVPESVPELA